MTLLETKLSPKQAVPVLRFAQWTSDHIRSKIFVQSKEV